MKQKNISLDLSFLRDWQKHFFKNHKLRNVLVVHRRAWKTIVTLTFLLYKALTVKGDYWYIAPFLKQAKQIAWTNLLKITSSIPDVTTNASELKITLPNGSTISLFGADNQEALRWLDLRGVVLDEYKDISSTLYSEIVAPMINAYKDGWVVWIWTPWGKNQFYDKYQEALSKPSLYFTQYLDVYSTWLLDEEQIERAIEEGTDKTGDDSAFRQEYLLDWNVSAKHSYYGSYINKVHSEGRVVDNLYDPHYYTFTAWDIGINDYTCIVFFQYIDKEIRIVDYYQNNAQWFAFYRDVLEEKPYKYKYHFLPHDIRARELWTWLTRQETFESYFWYDSSLVVTRHSVQDGINAVREIIGKCLFDTSLVEYLNKLSDYKPKLNKEWLSTWVPEHSDVADTIRYLALAYNEYVQPEEEEFVTILDYDDFI